MGTFFITLDASSTYSADAPLLEILVDGVVVSSVLIDSSFMSSSFGLSFAGTYPSSLSLRFNDTSPESGRSVAINSVSINGKAVDNANLSALSLNQNDTSDINTSNISDYFGEEDLTLADLGTVTITGTAASEVLKGTASADVIDGQDDADNIKGLDGDDKISAGAGNDIVRGGNGDDVILGDGGLDNLRGEAGADAIYGGSGMDYLDGGEGDDFLNGGADNDTLVGGLGDDSLHGGSGNDVLKAGDGDDTLVGGEGRDLLDGGEGNDLLSGGDSNDTLRGRAGNDTLYGDNGNDRLFGHEGDDELHGGEGNDKIEGGTGDDTIYGGNGTDVIRGEEGNDVIDGGGDNDGIYAGAGDDIVDGGSGWDRVEGGEGNDTLSGGEGNDTVLGDAGVDYVYGNDGLDRVRGGDGNDFVYGGDGNDQVFGDAGDDEVYGGNGNDLVNGNEGDDLLYGEAGLDKIFGHEGNDTIYGGDDNDRIYGNDGDDVINGDAGNDTLYAASVHEIVTVTETVDEVGLRIASLNAGVSYNAETNSFYQFVSGSFNWNTANSNALSATLTGLTGVNGHLATVTSAAETTFIQGLTGTSYAWVNGTDSGTEGEWVYTSGAEAGTHYWTGGAGGSAVGGEYANFYNGAPNDASNQYDYSLFLGSNYSGEIYAYTQTYNTNYVVEWDAGDLSAFALTSDIFKVMDEGASNIVNGGDGADTIYGSAGTDILNGDAGNDVIHSGTTQTIQDYIDDILFNNPNVFYNADTNSFYKYVEGVISHTDAIAGASSQTLVGLEAATGYLATITTTAEQTFIGDNLVNNSDWAWVDGSDSATEGSFVYETGALAGTAFDTSLSWYGGSPTSTNQAGRDHVILWDGGGDVLYAWADTSNARGYVVEWDAAGLYNLVGQNTLNGGDGADELYGSGGTDIFYFDNTNDIDDIFDFDTATGDAIDVSSILSFDSATDSITDFVQLTESGGSTTLSVDVDGTAGGTNFVDIALIDGVTGLDVVTMLADGSLIA